MPRITFWSIIILISLSIIGFFALFAYCSFPISDDFIMALDMKKGFLWQVMYWLSFWLSAWTIVALEVSIPLSFGYLDYGIWFFLLIVLLLGIDFGLMFKLLFRLLRVKVSPLPIFGLSILCTALFLQYAFNISETIYWNIGAIAYTYSLITYLAMANAYLYGMISGYKAPPAGHRTYWALLAAFVLVALVTLWLGKLIPEFVAAFDAVFAGKRLYLFWLLLLTFTGVLAFYAAQYPFLNYLLTGIWIVLAVGSGPQFVLLTNAFFLLAAVFMGFFHRKIHLPTLIMLALNVVFSLVVVMLPATRNRVAFTTKNIVIDHVELLKAGIKFVKDKFFLTDHLWLVYVAVWVLFYNLAPFIRRGADNHENALKKYGIVPVHAFFLGCILTLALVGVVVFYLTKGYFPDRLVHNFTSLLWLTVAIYAMVISFVVVSEWKPAIHIALVGFAFVALLYFSQNLQNALAEWRRGEPLAFRAYKLQVFEQIKNCPTDTCEVPYKAFNMKTVGDQHFIFPNETGFERDHKLFISRYFGKAVIRYDTASVRAAGKL